MSCQRVEDDCVFVSTGYYDCERLLAMYQMAIQKKTYLEVELEMQHKQEAKRAEAKFKAEERKKRKLTFATSKEELEVLKQLPEYEEVMATKLYDECDSHIPDLC